ncbi:MAG: hypothetical protein ACKN9T_15795 [Candidatus Methylumidiphilus sp.]
MKSAAFGVHASLEMIAHMKEQYITDPLGNRTGVVISIKDYEEMLAELEELETLRAYDEAKASSGEEISFESAIAEIEASH